MIENLIIGAGTSGIKILKNVKSNSKLAIDKCEHYSYPFFYRVPLFIGLIFGKSKYIRHREFVKKKRSIPFYESNVVGGASEINGCVHAIGNKLQWDKALENSSLNHDEIMKSYEKIFNNQNKKSTISLKKSYTNIIDNIFFDYLKSKNIKSGNMIFSDEVIFGPIGLNVGSYNRSSVKDLIEKKDKNFIKNNIEAYDIEFDKNYNLIGINTSKGLIKAKRLILSAGTIGTNKILLSTKKKLQAKHNHDPISNLVGTNIQDHPNFRIKVFTKKKFDSLNEINNSIMLKIKYFIKHVMGMPSPFMSTGASSALYYDFSGDGIIDTKIQIVQFTEKGRLAKSSSGSMQFDTSPGFSIALTIINPKSYGYIKLLDNGKVDINPDYFSDSHDIDIASKAIKFVLNFLQSKFMKGMVNFIEDLDILSNDPVKFILNNHYSGYHLIGGCSIKDNGVLNPDFSVKGVNGLYVCDASCLNMHVSSNTHAPILCLADSFSRRLYEI